MPTPNDFIASLDETGSQGLLRAALQGRLVYFIDDAEDPQDFTAQDPILASIVPIIGWQSNFFWYDPTDTTSVHDGLTVLVTDDGKRYKLRADLIDSLSVLDKDLTAPPGSPIIGDRYLVPAAATGAWVGEDEAIAHYTARGWEFEEPRIGMILYVEDEDAFYHYNAAGTWIAGFGDSLLSANSVLPSNVLGGRIIWIVENQTTNAPPGSPAAADTYIIGPTPSGAWAGNAGKIALRNAANSAWIIIAPTEGYRAYDKATDTNYRHTGSVWASDLGVYTSRYADSFDASAAQAVEDAGPASGTIGGYAYSSVTAPTSSEDGRAIDAYQPSLSAKKAGAEFELEYWGRWNWSLLAAYSAGAAITLDMTAIGVFVDAEANARDWLSLSTDNLQLSRSSNGTSSTGDLVLTPKKLRFTLADTSAHTIKIRFFCRIVANGNGGNNGQLSALSLLRRRIIIREAA